MVNQPFSVNNELIGNVHLFLSHPVLTYVHSIVVVILSFQFSFFREKIVVIASSELRPVSNERYENSTFYGPFRFLIFVLIITKKAIL